jgi:thiamine biosynthesis lipoprotein
VTSKPTTFSFEAIGTHWQIDIDQAISPKSLSQLRNKIDARIEQFDQRYSRFRPDSWVTQISKQKGAYTVPNDAEPLLSLYHKLYTLTDGLVTPLIGQMLVDAGYDESYSLTQKKELVSPLSWDEVITYNHPTLTLHQPALLDFGALGKGYLIDLVAGILEQEGITAYCVDGGGDIKHGSKYLHKLEVGLENPDNLEQVIGIATLRGESICASAGNRRKWRNFHHIMNPLTRKSVDSITATWVTAKTTLLADAMATALFFVDPATLAKVYDFEYLILSGDNTLAMSKQFPAELFIK